MLRSVAAVLFALLALAPAAHGTTFTGGALTIPEVGQASPYPSVINVSGIEHGIGKLIVTVNLKHDVPEDVDMELLGPRGQSIVLMSDAGSQAIDGGLSFVEAAAAGVPDLIAPGTYRPTNVDDGQDAVSGNQTALSGFNGTDANGSWQLFVVDDASGDDGQISSWKLNITPAATSPVAWESNAYSVPESAGAAVVTLKRPAGGLSGTLTYLSQDAPGTHALNGVDYIAVSGTLTFSPGETSKVITIPVINDLTDEANKTFRVHLSAA